MERDEWEFPEATVNIFTLYGLERLHGLNLTSLVYRIKGMPSFFYVAFYWIQRFGWQSLQTFFSKYEIDIANKVNLPKNAQDKIDQWAIRFSRIVGGNVIKHLEAYDIYPSKYLIAEQLAGLPVLDTEGMLNKGITNPSLSRLRAQTSIFKNKKIMIN